VSFWQDRIENKSNKIKIGDGTYKISFPNLALNSKLKAPYFGYFEGVMVIIIHHPSNSTDRQYKASTN
jgi:hypothetical protein